MIQKTTEKDNGVSGKLSGDGTLSRLDKLNMIFDRRFGPAGVQSKETRLAYFEIVNLFFNVHTVHTHKAEDLYKLQSLQGEAIFPVNPSEK